MAQPLTESDIIFPHLSNTPNFSSTLSSLKRSALSITNRLNSITRDSEFVTSVAAAYGLPLVANERCGSWYIPLDSKAASVYFKSTDGHMGEWAFSLRRLNLQLLDVISRDGGCVIVDSTRRGKSMPDALSKTVPLWCCVINRAVFGADKQGGEALNLFTPPAAVSESENVQMERRVDGFVQQFLDICKPDIPALRSKLQKPLRPLWVTQASTLPASTPDFPAFHPVVLCTASRRVRGAEASEGGYIQGAADDHEAWSHGLTPALFWRNRDTLLRTNEEDVSALIASLIENSQHQASSAEPTLIAPTRNLYVSASENVDLAPFHTVISCTPQPLPQALLKSAQVGVYLHLACGTGKLGSRDLRAQLPALRSLTPADAGEAAEVESKTLICCPSGTDLSVGTALAWLCLFTRTDGTVTPRARETGIDKTLIKQRLSWISSSNAALNPSRATLQSVNSALMSPAACASAALPRPQILTSAEILTPDAIFQAFETGTYTFHRTLSSARPSQPSGSVVGTAHFKPTRLPRTLLYTEKGVFTTSAGLALDVERRYVYQLVRDAGGEERVRVSFADHDTDNTTTSDNSDEEGGLSIGAIFVEMGDLRAQNGCWAADARERHVCGGDVYYASWRFGNNRNRREGSEMEVLSGMREWEVAYAVLGEKKDYMSSTVYTRV